MNEWIARSRHSDSRVTKKKTEGIFSSRSPIVQFNSLPNIAVPPYSTIGMPRTGSWMNEMKVTKFYDSNLR